MKEYNKRIFNSAEIARLAGVSRSTVSRVVNNYPNVSESKREKVLRIIEQYGYTPNSAARVLTGKKTNTIGLFFVINSPGINYFKEDAHADFILASIAEAASHSGFFTLINIIHEVKQPDNIKMIKEIFYQKRIDAGIFIGCSDNEPVIEELIKEGFIVGVLDYNVKGRKEINCVVANFDDKFGEQAVDYLVSLGHKKIMGIHGDLQRFSGMQRYNSFIRGMKKYGLEIRDQWMLFPGFERFRAKQLMDEFLASGYELPSAIFCANDTIAYGVIDALKRKGILIPDDVSIVGVDDSNFSAYIDPPLTTFRVDFQEVLSTLTQKVVECVKADSVKGVVLEFGGQLIVRNSCKEVKSTCK
ncbi:LacI family DNA-binding transcriptional regulator [Caldanaerobius polysaccharolyticus]|uniref:LacI family DNA-binding transcriptional regulator n=1 Tax=Caldanaerobius polysaccharolyticus TaxID=44256 RepID=UPI0004795A70|nr:LacI family DNA-binding transcriptional regulator [Caldanaerobius polysaccharolyticus]